MVLKTVKLKKELFIKILDSFSIYTEKVDDITKYKSGYRDKQTIYYTEDQLICTESHLSYLEMLDGEYTDWKQVIVSIDNENQSSKVIADITGSVAKSIVIKNLKRYYTTTAINEILNSYTDEYDYDKKQYHITPTKAGLTIYKNCIGYDINGAHNDALVEMFPKAKNFFAKLYEERKIKPENKKIVNYYVGTLNARDKDGNYLDFPKAYNHIVQRTTHKLLEGMNLVDGITIYANTDGFISQDPICEIPDSKELGKFKLEMKGDFYTYVDKNYWCIQYIDKNGNKVLKGNVMSEVRDKIDLFNGKVVHYDKVKNKFDIYEAKNITQEIVEGEIIW